MPGVEMVGGEARGEHHDRPRSLGEEKPRLLRRDARDHLWPIGHMAYQLGGEVLQRGLIALGTVNRDGDALIGQERIHKAIDEERNWVLTCRRRVRRVRGHPGALALWVAARALTRKDDTLVHHGDHEGVEIVNVRRR